MELSFISRKGQSLLQYWSMIIWLTSLSCLGPPLSLPLLQVQVVEGPDVRQVDDENWQPFGEKVHHKDQDSHALLVVKVQRPVLDHQIPCPSDKETETKDAQKSKQAALWPVELFRPKSFVEHRHKCKSWDGQENPHNDVGDGELKWHQVAALDECAFGTYAKGICDNETYG